MVKVTGIQFWFQSSSVSQSCPTLCDPMDYSTTGLPVYHKLLEFTQTHVHWAGDAIQPSHPVFPFSSCLQFFSSSEFFQMSQFVESVGQNTGVSASACHLNDNYGLISFRIDLLDLLQSKGLSKVFSNHSSKAPILQCSAFFIVQLSNPYMTTGKTIALTRWTFAGNVMSLLFNMLSRLVITFFQGVSVF